MRVPFTSLETLLAQVAEDQARRHKVPYTDGWRVSYTLKGKPEQRMYVSLADAPTEGDVVRIMHHKHKVPYENMYVTAITVQKEKDQ